MKIYTTFKLLKGYGACNNRYKHLAKKLGGIKRYGADKPISFLKILKHNGTDDTLWALRATPAEQNDIRDKFARTLARRYALAVIHLWEPPEIVVKYLETGNESIRAAAWAAARAAAWAAAGAAAGDAARAAAWAAAGDEHQAIQTKVFKEVYKELGEDIITRVAED